MAPEALAHVLRPLAELFNQVDHPDLLVGLGVADDAAVYRLGDGQALVATTDFFTPIVDDPYAYGAIAAANSMSDVYAMGGRVLFALNVAAFPADLPPAMIGEILRGGAEKVREAGAVIAGGHTIQDKEPKYGLVVLGLVDPARVLTKGGARPGDRLVLTKPLGTGVITTAFMRDLTTDEQMEAATASMLQLNRAAAEAAVDAGVLAATDITGFGLLGHASEMVRDQGSAPVGFRFYFDRLPWLPGAREFGAEWVYPGGAHNNRKHFSANVRFDARLDEAQQVLCFAPETSGGLLMAVPSAQVEQVLARLDPAWVIGEVIEAPGIEVR
jgi:selenide, water dikinase